MSNQSVPTPSSNSSKMGMILFLLAGFAVMGTIVFTGLFIETDIVPNVKGIASQPFTQTPKEIVRTPNVEEIPTNIPVVSGDPAMTVRNQLGLWFAADRLPVTKDTSRVPVAIDMSGKGNHAKQVIPASRPTYLKNMINGKPVLRFDGYDDALYCETMLVKAQSTIYVVWQKPAPAGQQYQRLYSSGGDGVDYQKGGAYLIPPTANNGAGDAVPQISKRIYAAPVDLRNFILGRLNASLMQYYGGDIAEMLVFWRVLSPDEQSKVEQYLRNKYAISIISNG